MKYVRTYLVVSLFFDLLLLSQIQVGFTVNVSLFDMLLWEFTQKGGSGVYTDRDWENVLVTGTEENDYGKYDNNKKMQSKH